MMVTPEFASHPQIRPIGAWALWVGRLLFAAYQAAGQREQWGLFRIVTFDSAAALPAAISWHFFEGLINRLNDRIGCVRSASRCAHLDSAA